MENKTNKPSYKSLDGFIRPSPAHTSPTRKVLQLPRPITVAEPSQSTPTPATFNRYYSPYAASAARQEPVQPRQPKVKSKRSTKRRLVRSALAILFAGFILGGWYGSHLLGNINKVFHGNVFSDVHALLSNNKLKGEDRGRVNILLAGNSADDPHHGGAELTDTIMVVSIDTRNHTGFMLSVPRDLWVNIPGWSHQKINAANDVVNFNQSGYPKGGMGQLQQIVQTELGIPIDYYALVNYTAFKDAVNSVGGIPVTIQSPDPRGLYDPNIAKADSGPLRLPNGLVNLDGQTALNLARARGDPCFCGHVEYGFPQSDYNRTQHQRQMLTALIQKGQTAGVIGNPIRVSQLFNTFGKNVATDLSLQDVVRFTEIAKGINVSKLQPLTLGNDGQDALLTAYTAPDGEAALIPKAGLDDFGQVRQYYQKLTSNSPVAQEAPTAVILNASGITGLARKEATLLQSKGFNVLGATNANGQYNDSLIVDLSGSQRTASRQLLQSIYTRNTSTTTTVTSSPEAREAQSYKADFVIILGQNTDSMMQP